MGAASDYDRKTWVERAQQKIAMDKMETEYRTLERRQEEDKIRAEKWERAQRVREAEALKKAARARIIDAAEKAAEQQKLEEKKARSDGFDGWNEKSAEHQERLIRQILRTKRADELRDELRKVETRND